MGGRGSPQNGGGIRNKKRKEREEYADAPLAHSRESHGREYIRAARLLTYVKAGLRISCESKPDSVLAYNVR